jgi:hypothetical protein
MSEGARHGEAVGLHGLEKRHALREEGTMMTPPVDVSVGGHRLRARVPARLATRGIYWMRGGARSLQRAARVHAVSENTTLGWVLVQAFRRVCGANVDHHGGRTRRRSPRMADATEYRSPTAGMAVGDPGPAVARPEVTERGGAQRTRSPSQEWFPDTSRGRRSRLAARRRGADAPCASVAPAWNAALCP